MKDRRAIPTRQEAEFRALTAIMGPMDPRDQPYYSEIAGTVRWTIRIIDRYWPDLFDQPTQAERDDAP